VFEEVYGVLASGGMSDEGVDLSGAMVGEVLEERVDLLGVAGEISVTEA